MLNSDHHDIGALANPCLAKGLALDGRAGGDDVLVHFQFHAARRHIDEVHDVRTGEDVGDSHRPDRVRAEHTVGPGAQQLRFRGALLGAADDEQVLSQAASRQRYEDVVCVVGQYADQRSGAQDAGLQERGLFRSVAQDVQHLVPLDLTRPGGIPVDDHDGRVPLPEPLRHERAHTAEAADDDMPAELADLCVQFPTPQHATDLAAHDHRGNRAEGGEDRPDPEDNDQYRPCPPRAVQREDLAVSHRGEGGRGHECRIRKRRPFQYDIARRADQVHRQQHKQGNDESFA